MASGELIDAENVALPASAEDHVFVDCGNGRHIAECCVNGHCGPQDALHGDVVGRWKPVVVSAKGRAFLRGDDVVDGNP